MKKRTDLFLRVSHPTTNSKKERYTISILPVEQILWQLSHDERKIICDKLRKVENYVRFLRRQGKITQWYGAGSTRIGIYCKRELYEEVHAVLSAFLKMRT